VRRNAHVAGTSYCDRSCRRACGGGDPGTGGDYSNLHGEPRDLAGRSLGEVGDIIEWINRDVLAHTATARNGDFDVTMPPKKTVRLVLKKAGSVEYYCRYHPNMKATLKIEP
jgi:hypothetical protein